MVCERAFEDDRPFRYLAGELAEPERDAFEVHVLECDECRTALQTVLELPAALRATAVASPAAPAPPGRSGSWSRPAPWLSLAAGIGVTALSAGFFLGKRSATEPPPVYRSSSSLEALTVKAILNLSQGSVPSAPRDVVLLDCAAPAAAGSERIDLALRRPNGQPAWETEDAPATEGRLRVIADLQGAQAGNWSLEVRLADLAGRPRQTISYGFAVP